MIPDLAHKKIQNSRPFPPPSPQCSRVECIKKSKKSEQVQLDFFSSGKCGEAQRCAIPQRVSSPTLSPYGTHPLYPHIICAACDAVAPLVVFRKYDQGYMSFIKKKRIVVCRRCRIEKKRRKGGRRRRRRNGEKE